MLKKSIYLFLLQGFISWFAFAGDDIVSVSYNTNDGPLEYEISQKYLKLKKQPENSILKVGKGPNYAKVFQNEISFELLKDALLQKELELHGEVANAQIILFPSGQTIMLYELAINSQKQERYDEGMGNLLIYVSGLNKISNDEWFVIVALINSVKDNNRAKAIEIIKTHGTFNQFPSDIKTLEDFTRGILNNTQDQYKAQIIIALKKAGIFDNYNINGQSSNNFFQDILKEINNRPLSKLS